MTQVTELRGALTVDDFGRAVVFYRDALGLEQIADWTTEDGPVVVPKRAVRRSSSSTMRRRPLLDGIEAGRRVSGVVRLAFEVPHSDAAA